MFVGIVASMITCFAYVTKDPEQARIDRVNIHATLDRAEEYVEQEKWVAFVLTYWCIRDQTITPDEAERITQLYFDHVDSLQQGFQTWHTYWAVANYYKGASPDVQGILEDAYQDASRRASEEGGAADRFTNGDETIHGDIHSLARHFCNCNTMVDEYRF